MIEKLNLFELHSSNQIKVNKAMIDKINTLIDQINQPYVQVEKMNVKDGDTLVFKFPDSRNRASIERFMRNISKLFIGKDVRVVVVPDDVKTEVVGKFK